MKVALILLVHLIAILAGLYYYWDQFVSTPLPLLVFVPDCPLYVLLVLPLLLRKAKGSFYPFFVSSGLVKYGLWTVFVLVFYSDVYFAPQFFMISFVFLLGHIGMFLEGLYFLPKNPKPFYLSILIGWFLVNDFADYYFGTAPPIPYQRRETVEGLTVASSFAIPILLFALKEKINQFKERLLSPA
ncbi:MAG: DUF1405 domain-containing protein [Candidatus Anstonellaceae archaeon]